MPYWYRTPAEGNGSRGDPYRPAHEDEMTGDPENYIEHLRGARSSSTPRYIIASDVRLNVYEEYAEDDDSAVEKLGEDDVYSEYDADDPLPRDTEVVDEEAGVVRGTEFYTPSMYRPDTDTADDE